MHIHLYLDPGSGSFLLQLLLAAILGGAFAIKMYWKKLKAFFRRTPDGGSPASPGAEKDAPPADSLIQSREKDGDEQQ